jgi:hypothetical protein
MPPPKVCLTSILGRQGQHHRTNYSSSLHGQSGIGEKLHAAHGPVRCPRRTRGKAEILSAMGRAPDPCARASGKSRNRAGAIPSRRLSVTIVISSVTDQTGRRGGHADRRGPPSSERAEEVCDYFRRLPADAAAVDQSRRWASPPLAT